MKRALFFFPFVLAALCGMAQDACGLFSKAMEVVNEKSRKEQFKGQILKGQRNGMGVLLHPKDSSVYVGDFYRDAISGFGMFVSSAGSYVEDCDSCIVYVGNWKKGVKSGFGICYAENGDVLYKGQFEAGKPVGAYPARQADALRYFSSIVYENGDAYVGELKGGVPDGYGILAFANGDLWMSSFKQGEQAGVGLYMLYNGEWETLNVENGKYSVISTSVNYANIDAARKASVRSSLSEAFSYFAAAAATGLDVAQGVHDLKNGNSGSYDASVEDGYSASGYGNGGSGSSSGSSSKKSSAPYSLSENQSKNTDSKTYACYDSLLRKMRSGNMEYNDRERREWQSKMREIREKWESRGERFQHSSNEDWGGK